MLSGVILNLLNNAVKYSPAGSEVNLRVTGTEANVIFEVCNPGSPIPPEDLAHLFEPFLPLPVGGRVHSRMGIRAYVCEAHRRGASRHYRSLQR